MSQPDSPVAPFTDIPEGIDEVLRHLLSLPPDPSVGAWLIELIRASNHMSTGDNMRWRFLSMLWVAAEYDINTVWPYIMWLNQNQPMMSDHLTEILSEALDDFSGHLRLARWMTQTDDKRLTTFLSDFDNLPISYKMERTFAGLLSQADAPELAPWLENFCRQTAEQVSPYTRPWHLFAAVWIATCFDPAAGLAYLKPFSDDGITLSAAANITLMELSRKINATAGVIQWIADCPDAAVKTMLCEFGHPNLSQIVASLFQNEPDYHHLTTLTPQAADDAARFQRNQTLLEKVGISPSAHILELGCGPLGTQSLLLHSAGYQVTGIDLEIPPAYLPLTGVKQRLKRGKYVKAWRAAGERYFTALANESGLKLNWHKLNLQLADLTRFDFPDATFEVVICCNHLHRAPDVHGLLAEAARVLKPGGLLLADFIPWPSLNGALDQTAKPWSHLRAEYRPSSQTGLSFNRWRESQYRTAFERHFRLEQWLPLEDTAAQEKLTPDLRQEYSDFAVEELTRKEVVVLARK